MLLVVQSIVNGCSISNINVARSEIPSHALFLSLSLSLSRSLLHYRYIKLFSLATLIKKHHIACSGHKN